MALRLILAVLATWRVTHLLASEDGPADIVFRFRRWLGQRPAGKLMDCFNCMSVWIAAPMALFVSRQPVEWFLCWLAVSGGACLLDRLGRPLEVAPPPPPLVPGEVNHVLWPETRGSDD